MGTLSRRPHGRVPGHSCVCPRRGQPFCQRVWPVSCGLSGPSGQCIGLKRATESDCQSSVSLQTVSNWVGFSGTFETLKQMACEE